MRRIRIGNDVTFIVGLKSASGSPVSWSDLDNASVSVYANEHKEDCGLCELGNILDDGSRVVKYKASNSQMTGLNSLKLSADYKGNTFSVMQEALIFVRWSYLADSIRLNVVEVDMKI